MPSTMQKIKATPAKNKDKLAIALAQNALSMKHSYIE